MVLSGTAPCAEQGDALTLCDVSGSHNEVRQKEWTDSGLVLSTQGSQVQLGSPHGSHERPHTLTNGEKENSPSTPDTQKRERQPTLQAQFPGASVEDTATGRAQETQVASEKRPVRLRMQVQRGDAFFFLQPTMTCSPTPQNEPSIPPWTANSPARLLGLRAAKKTGVA